MADGRAARPVPLDGVRVGIAAVSLSRGGAERVAAEWAAAAHGAGADVRVFAVESGAAPYALPGGVGVTVAGKTSRLHTWRVVRSLRRFASECDVVAAFQPYLGVLCWSARLRSPWVLVTGQDPRHIRDTSGVPRFLHRIAFHRAAAAAAPSRGLIDCYEESGLHPGGPWRHIPNAVPERAFAGGHPPGEGVLWVGRLVPEKRPLLALRAAAAAGLPITFLGDGPLRGELFQQARQLGVTGSVRLLGFTPDPWSVYAAHRVLLLTSRYETFGNVIAESLAAGRPVVSVDCDFGPREILAGARHSALVPDDVDALATALREVHDGAAEAVEECHALAARYRPDAVAPLVAELLGAAGRRTPVERPWGRIDSMRLPRYSPGGGTDRRSASRARMPLVAWVAVAVLGLLASAAAWTAVHGTRGSPAGAAAPARMSSGPLTLHPSGGWRPAKQAAELPGMRFSRPVRLEDRLTGLRLEAGMLPATSTSLLPAAFVRRLDARPGQPLTVRLDGGERGQLFRGLMPAGASAPVDVYVLPTTDGVATATCTSRLTAGSSSYDACWDVVKKASVGDAEVLALGPDAAFRQRLAGAITGLNAARERARRRLAGRVPAQQAGAATMLAAAYDRAVEGLRGVVPPAPAWPAQTVRDLRAAAAAYRRAGTALLRADAVAYARERDAVHAHEHRLAALLDRQAPAAMRLAAMR